MPYEYLYPNGNGYTWGGPWCTDVGGSWAAIDDPQGSPDDATTCTYIWSETAVPLQTFVRINSTNSGLGSSHTPGGWATYSDTFSRPGGGSWVVSDLNGMEVGCFGLSQYLSCTLTDTSLSTQGINITEIRVFARASASLGKYGTTNLTQLYVRVTYVVIVDPTVTTQACTNISTTGATGNGNITDTGGENCTRRGFCYMQGTSGDPDIGDDKVYDDGSFGTGAYTKAIPDLNPGTSYRVRAYTVNSVGTSYGSTVQLVTKPEAPTNVTATDGDYWNKVTVTWTKSTGAIGYQVYRDGSPLGWLGDVATVDDTGADTPSALTPGNAEATNGEYDDKVALSIEGLVTPGGTVHTYKVRARSLADADHESTDSDTDTGYRGYGDLSYQWQRSSSVNEENYANISGATTMQYDDTGAPANGSRRWYRCVLSAAGMSPSNTGVDRGYRRHIKDGSSAVVIVRDSDGDTLAYVTDIIKVGYDYRVNQLPTCQLTLPIADPAAVYMEYPNELCVYLNDRLIDIFRISVVDRSSSGQLDVTGQQVGCVLADEVAPELSYELADNKKPSDILAEILTTQVSGTVTLGGVDPSLDYAIAYDCVSSGDSWAACKLVRDTVAGYLYVEVDPDDLMTRRLWLNSNIGEHKGQQVRLGKNLLNAGHLTDYIDYATRLYPIGQDNLNLESKTYTRVDVSQHSTGENTGYFKLNEAYGCYKGWTGEGNGLPANVTVETPTGAWTNYDSLQAESGWKDKGSFYQVYPWYGQSWTTYINMTLNDPLTTTQVQFPNVWTRQYTMSDQWIPATMNIDIYYSGAWHEVTSTQYWGYDPGVPVTVSFAEQTITAVRLRSYSLCYDTFIINIAKSALKVWDSDGWAVDNTWVQGADERTMCSSSYSSEVPYVVSYTHAKYLKAWDEIEGGAGIHSAKKSLEVEDVDALISQGRVLLGDLKTPTISIDVGMVDLSVEEGRQFESLKLGNTVTIIDEDSGIEETLRVVRIAKPDLHHPENVIVEFGTMRKDVIDVL